MMASSTLSKEVIDWYATCGKEAGRQYPGRQNNFSWREYPKPTREYIDKLPRPYRLPPSEEHDPFPYYVSYTPRIEKWEKAWNLPVDHPRHILKFPPEIIERILFFCLTAEAVGPVCVARNTSKYWEGLDMQLPHYISCHEYDLYRVLNRPVKNGETGKWEDRTIKIWKRSIDATVLRTCKTFREVGQKKLYGANDFCFMLGVEEQYPLYHSPSLKWFDSHRDTMYMADHYMPLESEFRSKDFQLCLRDLWKHPKPFDGISDMPLGDWIFTDPFLRFLRSIGPTNASLLKTLTFTGPIWIYDPKQRHPSLPQVLDRKDQRHSSGPDINGVICYNLQYYLRVYGMFIERYCPNLQSLSLYIDHINPNSAIHDKKTMVLLPYEIDEANFPSLKKVYLDMEAKERAAFKSLLAKLIPKFKNLRKLEVHSNREWFGDSMDLMEDDPAKKHRIEIVCDWNREADEEMVGDIVKQVAKAFRERSRHPELVASNAQAREYARLREEAASSEENPRETKRRKLL